MHPRLDLWLAEETGVRLPLTIYAWPFMVCVAVLVAGFVSYRGIVRAIARGEITAIRSGLPTGPRDRRPSVLRVVERGMFVALAFGMVGAKLLAVLENLPDVVRHPSTVASCGMTVYGGLALGAIAVVVFVKRNGIRVLLLGDILAPGLMLAYGIGRVGCHLAGDGCWGHAATGARPAFVPAWLWAETYPGNAIGVALPHPGVHPTPLYELVACVVLAITLFALASRRRREGWLWFVYLVFAGLERFTIEIVRVERSAMYGLTEAQLVALASILAGLVGMSVLRGHVVRPANELFTD